MNSTQKHFLQFTMSMVMLINKENKNKNKIWLLILPGDGFLDQQEVEALLSIEIRKIYDPRNAHNDPNEIEEEVN